MEILDFFIDPYRNLSFLRIFLECLAVLLSLVSVFFSIERNILLYPIGITSTVIFTYISFEVGLFGKVILDLYYTTMSVYGWVLWKKTVREYKVEVSKMTIRERYLASFLFVISTFFVVLVYYLKPYIDNRFSMTGVKLGIQHLDIANYLDIFTFALFIIGTWLMARRKIECWLLFLLGDAVSVFIAFHKKIHITGAFMFVLTIMAIFGWISWRKEMRKAES